MKGTVAARLSSPKSLPTGDCPCLNSVTGTGNAGASPLPYGEPLSAARTTLGEGRVLDFGELSRAARRGRAGEKSDLFNILIGPLV